MAFLEGAWSFANYVWQGVNIFTTNPMIVKVGALVTKGLWEMMMACHSKKNILNTTKAKSSEVLPPRFPHSYEGFLLKESRWVVQLIQDVRAEFTNLQDHMVIVNYGSFVGDKFSPLMFNVCLAHVNNQIGEGKAVFDYMLGRGFFMLKVDGP